MALAEVPQDEELGADAADDRHAQFLAGFLCL